MLYAYINGNYDQPYRLLADFSIAEQLSNSISSDISILIEEDQDIPYAGSIIEIRDDVNTEEILFWGTCGIPKSPKYTSLNQPKIYQITCGNANSILARRLVNVAMKDTTVGAIVSELYRKYIQKEGILSSEIAEIDIPVQTYTAADINLQTVLDELATSVNACWQVTNDRRFIFKVHEEFPMFPATLPEQEYIVNHSMLLGAELQHTTKDSDLRTVQIIKSPYGRTSEQVEEKIYDGNNNVFTLSYPLAGKPVIYYKSDGNPVYITEIGLIGQDENNPNIAFLYGENSKEVHYNKDCTIYTEMMSLNRTLYFVYFGYYPVRISVSDADRISELSGATGTSGMVENVLAANSVDSLAEAYDQARKLLQQFSYEKGELTFWLPASQLYQPPAKWGISPMSLGDIELGTRMRFDLPEIGLTSDKIFVITERRLAPIRTSQTGDIWSHMRVELKLTDRSYLKSYGDIFNQLYDAVDKLSFRPDETIVDNSTLSEKTKCSEKMEYIMSLLFFATQTPIEQGSLFAPCDLGNTVYAG